MPGSGAGRPPVQISPSTRWGEWPAPRLAVLDLELDAYRRRVRAYATARNARRESGDTADGPSSVVLASNLLYLTPDQRAELTRRIFDLLRDYELEDPDHLPEGAERMATMWSMIPDDRGPAAAKPAAAKPAPLKPAAGKD